MIRDVDFVDYYLPPFMQKYEEPVAALNAEEPEFVIVWKAVDRILYNHFVSTADEYGISRFEKMLSIYPDITDTLEKRRLRVQNRWFNSIPYTIKALLEKLKTLLGERYHFSVKSDFSHGYELILTVYSIDDSRSGEIDYLLSTMVPMNIVTGTVYESQHFGWIYFGAVMSEADIIEMKQR